MTLFSKLLVSNPQCHPNTLIHILGKSGWMSTKLSKDYIHKALYQYLQSYHSSYREINMKLKWNLLNYSFPNTSIIGWGHLTHLNWLILWPTYMLLNITERHIYNWMPIFAGKVADTFIWLDESVKSERLLALPWEGHTILGG